MINPQTIEDALSTVLNSAGLTPPIAWPNKEFTPGQRPRIEVQHDIAGTEGGSLKGGQRYIQRGLMMATVIVDKGGSEGTDDANGFALQIAQLFPEGTSYSITGGKLIISRPPSIRAGYPDDEEWRTPVIVNWEAAIA